VDDDCDSMAETPGEAREFGVKVGTVSRAPRWEWIGGEGSPEGSALVGGLVRGVRWPLVVGIAAGVGTMMFGALVPCLIGRIIDYLMASGSVVGGLGYRCATLALVITLGAVLGIVQERCDTTARLVTSLRAMVWVNHHAVRLAGGRAGMRPVM
jgi:hypothetical protein